MFIDAIDPRKRIRTEAQAFWADEAHLREIAEIAFVEFEAISDCYDELWRLDEKDRLEYTSIIRRCLTEDVRLPGPGLIEKRRGSG